MNAPATLDPIRSLMGNIGDAEHEQRRRLYACRNVASFRVARTGSPTARQLLWIVADWGNHYVFAPAELEVLEDVAEFCRRLLVLADKADELEGSDGTA